MDVLNKFCSTVSSTVSQLSNALPGNPVTREYEAINHIASAGTGLVWKVYSGYKKSTRQEAAIFVFEKRQVERWSKADRDLLLETLRRGVAQLTRLRHPRVLTVHHQLEESRDSLAFATEPVFASLANVLGNTENMPTPVNPQIKNYKLFEVEIKYGLLQLGEGLAFLHNDAKILHHNVCPESIVINQQGAWKIFGFDFCVLNTSPADRTPSYPYVEYRVDLHWEAQPVLDYLAPECGLAQTQSPLSDIFSLGSLICALYNDGRPLLNCNHDFYTYKKNMLELKSLSQARLQCVVEGLRDLTLMMLNFTPELRPDEHEFIKTEFFEDVGVKTLNYLDSLFQWDNLQKSQFYKGLPQIIDKLPHRVCLYRVIPCLVKEFINPTMVPFVLPNVLSIAENCTKDEFTQHILPHLKPIMKLQEPIQVLLIFMQKMDFLLKLTPCEEAKTDVLPMFYRALESDAQQIQELCLTVLPNFATLIEYPAMKNALLPRIKRLCISTSYISVRVNCLVCIGKLLEHLDKWLVLDEILPFLPQIPSREPAVLMGILGIYKLVLTHKKFTISKEVMATKILPFLMPLSIENALTLNQFNALIAVIKEMVNRVENEHRVKLEQLNSIQNEQSSMDIGGQPQTTSTVPASTKSDLDEMLNFNMISNSTPASKSLATPVSSIVNNHSNSNGNFGTSDTLSIKDKQRLIKEQESVRRLHNEPSLNPTPALTKTNSSAPKDLTSSLMENNLSQMSLSKTPQIQWPSKPQPQAVTSPQSQWQPKPQATQPVISSGQLSSPMWPQTQPAIQWNQTSANGLASTQSRQNNAGTNGSDIQWNNSANQLQNNVGTNGSAIQWNSSANQLQNISVMNTSKMSMPSLIPTMSTTMSNTFPTPAKQLSASEINDLLS